MREIIGDDFLSRAGLMFLESFEEQFLNTDLNRTDRWIDFVAKNTNRSYNIRTNLRRHLTDSSSQSNVFAEPESPLRQKGFP